MNLIRMKIAWHMVKHVRTAGRETTSPTAVITNYTRVEDCLREKKNFADCVLVEVKRTDGPTEKTITYLEE